MLSKMEDNMNIESLPGSYEQDGTGAKIYEGSYTWQGSSPETICTLKL